MGLYNVPTFVFTSNARGGDTQFLSRCAERLIGDGYLSPNLRYRVLEADHDDLAFCRRVGLLIIGYEVNMQTVLPRNIYAAVIETLKGKLAGNNSVRSP